MIGAVQILVIGFKQPDLPEDIVRQVNLLRSSEAVRLLDVYAIRAAKGRAFTEGTVTELSDWDGSHIRKLLKSAEALRVLSAYTLDDSGFLVQGTPIPDLKVSIPEGANAVVLLIEHLWAAPLEDVLRKGLAFPLAGGWAGREVLREAGLDMDDTAE